MFRFGELLEVQTLQVQIPTKEQRSIRGAILQKSNNPKELLEVRRAIGDRGAISKQQLNGIFQWVRPIAPRGAIRGIDATGINTYQGITIDPEGDFNPERIQIQSSKLSANMGTKIPDGITGILSYSWGNFEVYPTLPFNLVPSIPQVKPFKASENGINIATYNIENFDARSRAQDLADDIVNYLDSPCVVALQEVQDDSGVRKDSTTTSGRVLSELVKEIVGMGGPKYIAFDIVPVLNQDGGIPGGNIRVAYLYNPSKVSLANSYNNATGGPLDAAKVVSSEERSILLNYNPVRVAPELEQYDNSRKPLAAHFKILETGEDLQVLIIYLAYILIYLVQNVNRQDRQIHGQGNGLLRQKKFY
eukprot:TRINITY_DN3726_c1_g1_i2.p1 TRINITY_DN3726_c1_g1~~TRINITY_DN3726_c1_g1_i2.p1  ORF type:complete len:380 (+),score=39.87 TRINITY_DN3726_c1_g1_i2:55-1140(+)